MLSEDDAKKLSKNYIRFNEITKKYEVRYNVLNVWGAPIVQPNKYTHLQQIAFRLGRDIRLLAEAIGVNGDHTIRYSKQIVASDRALKWMSQIDPRHVAGTIDPETGKELSLKTFARDILSIVPELKTDIGMDPTRDITTITDEEAAKIVQLQLIEESNNNWESRFPEDEHVWDWVDDPLPTTQPAGDATTAITLRARPTFTKQYFSLRKWPIECQRSAIQDLIKTSGPPGGPQDESIQPQPHSPQPVSTLTAAQRRRDAIGPYPRERWTGRGGPPNFPFGETPYQQAYQSFRMEEDLKDG